MLDSMTITRRQSEIRQALAGLAGKPTPTEDEIRSMTDMDAEYRTNETRFRAALIAEDTERREAGEELETRSGREWSEMVAGFEMRQVALALDEGRTLDGRTAEIVSELRAKGGFRGVPVPWQALEVRAGETVAGGTPNPITTRPIIDRLFPGSVAARMGVQMIDIGTGATEWPVVTSAVTAGWASGETGAVASPTAYATTDKAMKPDYNLGVQMKLTRKAMKQSGDALEAAIRRDMQGAMATEMDKAVFLGTGASGQPLGIIPGAATYGITVTAVGAAASWAVFRAAIIRFMTGNAATSPSDCKVLIRPEVYAALDALQAADAAPIWEWDRLLAAVGAQNVAMTTNALAAPTGSPLACTALLTTAAGGTPPAFMGAWGAIDMIRDPFSDAASGGLRLTALATLDVTVPRGVQLEILTGVRV